jgi:hypothetical protein
MYQCLNSSKCISKSRLLDDIRDCYHDDDEEISTLNKTCLREQNLNLFKCETTNECILFHLVQDDTCHCTKNDEIYCDDEHFDVSYAKHTISFQTICDGFNQLLLPTNDIYNETDETNCEEWQCNNIYTHCDGFWYCLNGVDEINCSSSSPLLNCSANHHICVLSKTKELMCLPIEKANDVIIDCIRAADEPKLCNRNKNALRLEQFHYQNDSHQSCIEHTFM